MYQEDVETNPRLTFISLTKKAKSYDFSKKVVHVRRAKLMELFEKLRAKNHQYKGILEWGQDDRKIERLYLIFRRLVNNHFTLLASC